MAGLPVKSNFPLKPETLCGFLSIINDPVNETTSPSYSTIGGVIRVGTEIFALSVAHAFLRGQHQSDRISSIKDLREFGEIESYEFGNTSEIEVAGYIEDNFDWDWALFRIPPSLYLINSIRDPDPNSHAAVAAIEDYIRNDDLKTGAVLIKSGISGTQRGTLYANSVFMWLEDKCMELMEIEMNCSLGN
jgi:hypothetical protein